MSLKSIKIYSTPTCPWCKKAKDFFKSQEIEFTDYNVALDKSKFTEMVEISNQKGVPVIMIEKEIIIGFNQDQIEIALKK